MRSFPSNSLLSGCSQSKGGASMINFAELQEREARRRLKLLGTTIEDASGAGLRTRARSTGLPLAILRQWHASYLHGGFEALMPSWKLISEATLYLIEQRFAQLGVCAEPRLDYASSDTVAESL